MSLRSVKVQSHAQGKGTSALSANCEFSLFFVHLVTGKLLEKQKDRMAGWLAVFDMNLPNEDYIDLELGS